MVVRGDTLRNFLKLHARVVLLLRELSDAERSVLRDIDAARASRESERAVGKVAAKVSEGWQTGTVN